MAPIRRKGARKAATAAGSCQKWKIGDLVLAKVKGFPAWPARVSEPKNWGFKEDLKKVFVYFFGTEQIAFCTSADVETFTEEKKVSLLSKRRGKGADFVRAVNEIIDSYEEFKRKEKVVADCTNENAAVNDALSGSVPDNIVMESVHKSMLKEDAISPVLLPELKIAESTGDDSDFTSLADAAVSLLENDTLHEHKMLAEGEPSFNVAVPYSSRRECENLQIADCVTRRRDQPGRRSRSSMVDTSRVKYFTTPRDDNCSYGDMVANISHDRTGRRSKRLRRSPDGSGKHFIHSPPLISNCSIDENGADTVTISDFFGFSDEVDVDSACKSVLIESAEYCGEELEHNQNIDFQSNAVRCPKKRRPNRKRTGNETIEFTSGLDKVGKVDSEFSNGHELASDHEKLTDHIFKENGDEHLPLVKRARVRMGASPHKMSSAGEQTRSQAADKILDISKKISASLNCEVNDSANDNLLTDRENGSPNGNSHTYKECRNLSPLNASTSKKLQCWEVKSQPFSSLLDGEAALPPSKRLHRALEAMTVNAAEDGQTSSDGPASVNTSINGYSSSSSRVCCKVTIESRVDGEVGVTDEDSPKSDPSIAEETEKASEEFSANGRTPNNHPINECCNDAIEAAESEGFKHLSPSSFKDQSCDNKDEKLDLNLSPVGGVSTECDYSSPGLVVQSEECEAESSKSTKTSVEPETQSVDKSLDPAPGKGSSPDSLQKCTNSQLSCEVNICIGTVGLPELALNEFELNHTMDGRFEKGAALRSPKATTSSCQEEHVSHSNSISDDLLVEKAVSTTRSSSSLTDGFYSGRHTSPLVSSVCNYLSLPNKTKTAVVSNAGYSPEGHMSVDRSDNADGKAGLSDAVESFEAVLGTLKRSKESIARATNKAIDCGRIDTASRVLEIITCKLENETSLHRKVDLFFLVDSITQCSRGMKGCLGGVYLQAIQTVLSRLVPAAAPPGSSARENRRQCLKVLRVWLEKRIFPDSIIQHHIRELDALYCSSSARISSRSLKTERPFDDPIRQMDGMMVDEYGSNSSIQLPGLFMRPMLSDGDCGSDSDENFEAVTPEHNTEYLEGSRAPTIEKHPHILEDVDGELEMEDVAPSCEDGSSSMCFVDSVHSNLDHFEHVSLPIAHKTKQPSTPPMSLVLPPPPPPSHAPSTIADSHCNLLHPKLHSSSVDLKDDIQESFGHRSFSRGNSFRHHGPDRSSFPHPPMRMPDGHTHDASSSYNSRSVLHPSTRPGSNIQATDASDRAFHLRPPHLVPPDQFSYVHPDQRMPSRRDVPPNPHRYHMTHCSDYDNFFRDRARIKHAPRDADDCWRSRDVDDCWRSLAPPFLGPRHPDFPRRPYGPFPYSGPPREPALPNHRWSNPRRGGMNHRKYLPHRSLPGGPIRVSSRGSNYWRPRYSIGN